MRFLTLAYPGGNLNLLRAPAIPLLGTDLLLDATLVTAHGHRILECKNCVSQPLITWCYQRLVVAIFCNAVTVFCGCQHNMLCYKAILSGCGLFAATLTCVAMLHTCTDLCSWRTTERACLCRGNTLLLHSHTILNDHNVRN